MDSGGLDMENERAAVDRRLGERRQSAALATAPQRRREDRRQSQRRQVDLGPPSGVEERRRCPDLRGVVFPLFFSPR
jgi:hypothetical protein